MKMSDAFPSQYLKASDLQNRNISVVIDRIEFEKIGEDNKPVLYFKNKEKGVVLNKTNANTIAMIYGDETDDWEGGELVLYPTRVDFQGKSVDAIRVRVPPRKPAPRQSTVNGVPVNPPRHVEPAPEPDDYGRGTSSLQDDDIPF